LNSNISDVCIQELNSFRLIIIYARQGRMLAISPSPFLLLEMHSLVFWSWHTQ